MIPWHYRKKQKKSGGTHESPPPSVPNPQTSPRAQAPRSAPPAGGKKKVSVADELMKLTKMRNEGVLSQAEFDLAMRKLLEH